VPAQTLNRRGLVAVATCLLLLVASAEAQTHATPASPGIAANVIPEFLRDVGIDQRLDSQLPLDLAFQAEDGSNVRLARYFGSRPVVLTFVYYDCPLLCSQVLAALVRGLKPLRLEAGRDFDVLAISFDPRDTPARAALERAKYVPAYGRRSDVRGFHFLTGSSAAIRAVTSAAGFRYSQDAQTGLFRHGAAVIVTTPDGRLSRYLPGVDFAPRDLQLSIVEAAGGRIGSFTDRVLLYCYQYDPASGRYGLLTMRLLQLGGVAVVCALGLLIGHTIWSERKRAA
jgi:protein SCO1/2